MASQAIEKLAERADRAVVQLKNYRHKAKTNEARVVSFVEGAAGAAAAGAADAYFDEPTVLGLPAVPLVSFGVALLGITELLPGAEHFAAVGAGGAHYAIGALTFKKVNEYESK